MALTQCLTLYVNGILTYSIGYMENLEKKNTLLYKLKVGIVLKCIHKIYYMHIVMWLAIWQNLCMPIFPSMPLQNEERYNFTVLY